MHVSVTINTIQIGTLNSYSGNFVVPPHDSAEGVTRSTNRSSPAHARAPDPGAAGEAPTKRLPESPMVPVGSVREFKGKQGDPLSPQLAERIIAMVVHLLLVVWQKLQ